MALEAEVVLPEHADLRADHEIRGTQEGGATAGFLNFVAGGDVLDAEGGIRKEVFFAFLASEACSCHVMASSSPVKKAMGTPAPSILLL